MDHIAHQPDLDGQAFHLTSPKSQRSGEVLNTFARAAHAPQLGAARRQAPDRRAAQGHALDADEAAAAQGRAAHDAGGLRHPRGGRSSTSGFTAQFDTRDTERALAGTDIAVPELDTYAEQAVGLLGAQPRPGPVPATARSRTPSTARSCSSPARRRASARRPRSRSRRAGGIPLLVARVGRQARGDQAGDRGQGRHAPTRTPPTSATSTRSTQLVEQVLSDHPAVDMLVNNAGRSIRRSIALSATTASTTSSARSSSTTSARSS